VRRSGRVAAAVAAAAVVAGCGGPAGEDAVVRTARQWTAAAQARDAAALCRLLTPAAAESVATTGETCEQAVGDLDLPGDGTVGEVQVWGDGALVRTGGDTLFLTRLAAGWRVNGAGCTPRGDRPYDCDVEG
jgi:hypothetical protein